MTDLNDRARFNLQKATVLLLESPSFGVDITAQILGALGVQKPYRSKSPEDAFKIVEHRPLDIIICDGNIPDGGAFEFVAKLRRSKMEPNRYCPVILMSGHTPESMVGQARDCGANFVIAKPISPRVLLERIVWLSQDPRCFVELASYLGPDRRFRRPAQGIVKLTRRGDDEPGPDEPGAALSDETAAEKAQA
jgi:CheY-like chemotaxis protein